MEQGFPGFLRDLVTALGGAVFLAFVLRWTLSVRRWSGDSSLFRALELLTEPFLIPLRRRMPRLGGIDLTAPVAAALAGTVTLLLRILLTRGHP
ncbi:MAG: YggT family protein [Fibrobacteria bacterium]|nr:YggT family protein [Fibrobacteria bacterium]